MNIDALTVTDTLTIGTDGAGFDATFHSGTASTHLLWDASEERLHLAGTKGNIHLGAQANVHGSGITLSSTIGGAIRSFADDGNANVGASVRNIQARTLLDATQTGGTIRSIQGQLKLVDGVGLGTGVYTGVQGYIELMGDHTIASAGKFSCFDASVEIASGKTLTVASGAFFAGVKIETTGAGTISNSGTCAALLVDNPSGAPAWPVGIQLTDCCTTGISIGNTTTGIAVTGTATTGILVSGACTDGIKVSGACTSAQIECSGTAVLASGEQAIYVNHPAETTATNGIWITLKSTVASGDLTGIRSRCYGNAASAGANVRGGYLEAKMAAGSKYAAMLEGTLSHADYSQGSITVSGDVRGLTAHISQGASLNAANLYGILVSIQTRGDETITTNDAGIMIKNEAVGGAGRQMGSYILLDAAIMGGGTKGAGYAIDGGTATDLLATGFLRLPDDGTICADAGTSGSGTHAGHITVTIGESTKYIRLHDVS